MRKFLLNRPFVLAMAFLALFVSLPPSKALAMPSASVSTFNVAARQAQIDQIMSVLSRPEARAHLVLMGIRQEDLKARLSQLDDRQLAMVADKADAVKAGGDALGIVVVVLVIAILVVLLMKLSDKTIEVKK